MPAAITHYLHAERVMAVLEDATPHRRYDRDAFLWGAQGADVFACHRLLPWQKGESLAECGTRLHEKDPKELSLALHGYWKSALHKKIPASYAAGFLCHDTMDRICHPYVAFLEGVLAPQRPGVARGTLHNEAESALDVIMMRREKGELACDFDLRDALPKNRDVQEGIVQLYAAVIPALLGVAVREDQLEQVLQDARRCFGLMNNRSGLKKKLLQAVEKRQPGGPVFSAYLRDWMEDGETDFANLAHAEWNDGERERQEDFFALFDTAVEQAAARVASFFRGEDRRSAKA